MPSPLGAALRRVLVYKMEEAVIRSFMHRRQPTRLSQPRRGFYAGGQSLRGRHRFCAMGPQCATERVNT